MQPKIMNLIKASEMFSQVEKIFTETQWAVLGDAYLLPYLQNARINNLAEVVAFNITMLLHQKMAENPQVIAEIRAEPANFKRIVDTVLVEVEEELGIDREVTASELEELVACEKEPYTQENLEEDIRNALGFIRMNQRSTAPYPLEELQADIQCVVGRMLFKQMIATCEQEATPQDLEDKIEAAGERMFSEHPLAEETSSPKALEEKIRWAVEWMRQELEVDIPQLGSETQPSAGAASINVPALHQHQENHSDDNAVVEAPLTLVPQPAASSIPADELRASQEESSPPQSIQPSPIHTQGLIENGMFAPERRESTHSESTHSDSDDEQEKLQLCVLQ